MKVFLGGTCNKSNWREELIPLLKIDYFNPVVKDWTPECQKEEIHQRNTCDIVLYCITPKMLGVYSIAEVVDDSNKRPEKTVFVLLKKDEDQEFSKAQYKSLESVQKMLERNGGKTFTDFGARKPRHLQCRGRNCDPYFLTHSPMFVVYYSSLKYISSPRRISSKSCCIITV